MITTMSACAAMSYVRPIVASANVNCDRCGKDMGLFRVRFLVSTKERLRFVCAKCVGEEIIDIAQELEKERMGEE